MEIVITEVTRMSGDNICVAGIDPESGARIRPVLEFGQITEAHLVSQGGLVDIKAHIDLGKVVHRGAPPETEDHVVDFSRLKPLAPVTDEEFVDLVNQWATDDYRSEFGSELRPHPNNERRLVSPPYRGAKSLVLGKVMPGKAKLVVTFGSVRAQFDDGIDLRVTDLRFVDPSSGTPREKLVGWINRKLSMEPAVFAFGLTRRFDGGPISDGKEYHWLQINAVHTRDMLKYPL